MADIIDEINTIGDLLTNVGVTRFYKQDLPKTYVANTLGIRWYGDVSESESGYHYRIERIYQVIYFGKSEVDCLQKIPKIQAPINQHIKAKLRESDGYITLGSLSFTKPFKTETDGVYAVAGVLPVSVRVAREFAPVPKIGNVTAEIAPKTITDTGEIVAEEVVNITTNPNYKCGGEM